ncbi:MAG: DnaJ domain-containing protein [Xenococcaceae cyanobacterium]
MGEPVRRKFYELVIHQLAFAKLLNYKKGWVWYQIKRELYEESEFEGFYLSELQYLARRLDYKPKWAYIAYSSLEEKYKLGHFPEGYAEPHSEPPRQPKQESQTYIDPLLNAIAFFGLERGFTGSELKRVYRSLAIRCHPDTGGSHDAFIEFQKHYEILQRHAL